MDAVLHVGRTIRAIAQADAEHHWFACAKLVVFANMPDDNPFMAGAVHGQGEADAVINIGVAGPGVVKRAFQRLIDEVGAVNLTLSDVAEEIKITASRITRVGELIGRELADRLGVRSASSICRWRPRPRSVIRSVRSCRPWVWSRSARPGRRRRSRCSTTPSRRAGRSPAEHRGTVRCVHPGDGRCRAGQGRGRRQPDARQARGFGGLFGESVVLPVLGVAGSDQFVRFGGRIPAPIQNLRN